MTELSIQYKCSPATGDYGNLTVENVAAGRLFLGSLYNQDSGVIYWTDSTYVPQVNTTLGTLSNAVDGLLEPTESGGVVSIDTGVANVNGYLYFNDVSVDFDIDGEPGNANATDIIVLRWSATTQTVRLTRLNGAAASTAVLTQTSTVWDIPIAEILLDGAGQFSALTDVRKLAVSPGTVLKIGEFTGNSSDTLVTFDNIPPVFSSLRLVGGVANDTGSSGSFQMRMNNDSGSNYDYTNHRGDGTTGGTTGGGLAVTSIDLGSPPGTNAANYLLNFLINIPMYKNTTWYKGAIVQVGYRTTSALVVSNIAGVWKSTSAITRLDLSLGFGAVVFSTDTKIELYGIV